MERSNGKETMAYLGNCKPFLMAEAYFREMEYDYGKQGRQLYFLESSTVQVWLLKEKKADAGSGRIKTYVNKSYPRVLGFRVDVAITPP